MNHLVITQLANVYYPPVLMQNANFHMMMMMMMMIMMMMMMMMIVKMTITILITIIHRLTPPSLQILSERRYPSFDGTAWGLLFVGVGFDARYLQKTSVHARYLLGRS